MKNNWIYPVICLISLNSLMLGGQSWLTWSLLLLAFVKLISLRQTQITIMTIGLCLVYGGRFWISYHSMTQPQQPVAQYFKVQPDAIQVAGDSVQLTAIGQQDGQTIKAYYRCQTFADKRRWQQVRHPVLFYGAKDFKRIQGATNQNEFDYARFLAQQKRCFYQLTLAKETTFALRRPSSGLDWLHYWRQTCALYLRKLPTALRFHAQTLLLGLREAQVDHYQVVLGRLGIIHLLSLSGLHVFYLVQVIRWCATYCRIPREWLNCMLFGLLPVYALLVGGTTSISRAIALILCRLLCEQLGIRQSRLDSWSLVLLVNLFWQPYLLHSMGGILSYLMAFALIYIGEGSTFKVAYWLSLLSLPVCLRFNYRWHVLTIMMNALVTPIYLPVVLGLVIVASVMLPVSNLVVNGCEWLLQLIYKGLGLVAQIPHAMITFGKIPLLPLLLIVTVSLLLIDGQAISNQWRKRLKRTLASLYLASFLAIHFNPTGQVVMFDIGQGDSLLIQTPFNRHQLLIDTGGRLALPQAAWQRRAQVSRAEKVTVNYLYSQGVDHIDAVALSHQDADHIGDLNQILKQIRVDRIICAAGLPQNRQFQRQIRPFLATVQIEPYLAGTAFKVGPQKFNVLAPTKPGKGENSDSLVLQAQIGGASWLFTGDLEQEGERAIIERYPQLTVDYLKVGHHGSETASDPTVIKKLHLKGALISAGRENRYGHPHQETLTTLQAAKVPYWLTAQQGMLIWAYGPGQSEKLQTTIKDSEK